MQAVHVTTAFANGLFMSLVLIVAIGAQNAYVLRQGLRREHVGAVVLFCAASDAVLIGAGVAGMAQALQGGRCWPPCSRGSVRPFSAATGSRRCGARGEPAALQTTAQGVSLSRVAVVAQAAGFTLLNPHVYLDTVLLVGSAGAQYAGLLKVWFVAGAATASALWFTSLGFGARLLAPVFARPRAWQMLDALIGGTMLLLAAMLAQRALGGL